MKMKHPGRTILLILAVEGLIVLNWQFPVVRFSIQWLNDLFLLQVLLAPAFVMLIVARNKQLFNHRRNTRSILMVGGAVTAALSFILLGILLLGGLILGSESLLDRCPSIALSSHSSVRIYRSASNGTPSQDYLVRQEMTLLSGILLVREIERGVKRQDANTFCDSLRAEIIERYDLKPYVYF